ncbi:MAG: helix-turn-helix domain-containing protein [Bacilli bacterium]
MQSLDNVKNYIELSLHETGREVCIPEKEIVFSQKDYHLFHYIISGKGVFEINGKKYNLHKGMIFYIPPKSDAKYAPDKKDPWTYEWLGFDGSSVSSYLTRGNISMINPVFNDKDEKLRKYFDEIFKEYSKASYLNIVCLGLAYELFGQILKMNGGKNENFTATESYVVMAKEFIDNSFQFDVKVEDIANSIGITTNYLANVFQKNCDMSPKQYLIHVRMTRAQLLIKTHQYKIKSVAKMVGYSNQLHFSSEFRKFYGTSPRDFGKKETDNNENETAN